LILDEEADPYMDIDDSYMVNSYFDA